MGEWYLYPLMCLGVLGLVHLWYVVRAVRTVWYKAHQEERNNPWQDLYEKPKRS